MLIYELPASSLKCRAQPNVIRRSFEPHDQMLYHRTILEPHTAYPIPTLPPPTPIHVSAEKRPLEEKSLPKKRSKVRITPVMRRVSRQSELPMEPVQIPQPPVQIPDVREPVQIPLVPQSPVQIPLVPQSPVQIPVSHVSEPPVQIPDVPEHVQIPVSKVPEPPVQIPVSQVPQSPVQIPLVQIPYVPEHVQIPVSQSPTATYADSTCIRTTCEDSTCIRTCADSRCSRTCADSSVTSPTTTYAASPRARHFGPFGVDRCIRPANVVRIWTPRTPAASHGTLYF
ncbi:hypothetical protein TNCV_4344611 [Trichonephila clavipes]|nr:hypothetical protein TNCV_4344611 [Trichonephila clavipes]